MEKERQEYPRAVTLIIERLKTIDEVERAIAETKNGLEAARSEKDPIHQNRIPDLEEMLSALEKRKHDLEIEKAA